MKKPLRKMRALLILEAAKGRKDLNEPSIVDPRISKGHMMAYLCIKVQSFHGRRIDFRTSKQIIREFCEVGEQDEG